MKIREKIKRGKRLPGLFHSAGIGTVSSLGPCTEERDLNETVR